MLLRRVVSSKKSFIIKQAQFSLWNNQFKKINNKKQESNLDAEKCILVDEKDKAIGFASKRDCHKLDDFMNIKLHRAFSVFLFNSNGDFLMHKRSDHKISFPNYYTNTCCSHPLYDFENEREEQNALGVKRAAQRRLNFELGIPTNQISLDDFHYMTRIHYIDRGIDGIYGEHEIDYVLFIQKDVDIKPNPDEISEIIWIKRSQIHGRISSFPGPITPWFRFIYESTKLGLWWNNLDRLDKFAEHNFIHKLN